MLGLPVVPCQWRASMLWANTDGTTSMPAAALPMNNICRRGKCGAKRVAGLLLDCTIGSLGDPEIARFWEPENTMTLWLN
jgi:hypothetical protein